MIASSAALFAVLATIVAGNHHLTVLPTAVTRDQAIAACANHGQQLAAITGATIEQASALLPAGASGWIASWNTDTYGGACLQLKAGTITAAASCAEAHLPICQGPHHHESSSSSSTHVPSSSSSCPASSSSTEHVPSSSSSCDFSSSSSSCDLSSSSSWSEPSSCDSSSSFSCSDSVSSDICSSSFTESSSSSSSVEKCDPCCAGVRKLTYQAPFGAGIYLAKVAQRFTIFDVFGPNACEKVATLSKALGVVAVLVGSDGTNLCPLQVDPNDPDVFPYGTTYVVSRAWALNQPIYALHNGVVYAANSLYNCYGEYRAIHLAKPLSELTFVNNNRGDVCYDRCKNKPRSCLALCNNELQRPSYLPKFKIGA